MTTYRHTPDMKEISGFGGGYEECCQDMLEAGMKFLEAQSPGFDPVFKGYEGVFGLITEDNEDAKNLTKATIDAAKGEATGAMHHAVVSRLIWIMGNGWDAYCTELSKQDALKG